MFNFMFSLFFLLSGATLYWVGYHNKDIGWNMRYLNSELNISLVDSGANLITGQEVIFTPEEAIDQGYYQQNIGVSAMLFGMLVFGMSMSTVYHRFEGSVKK